MFNQASAVESAPVEVEPADLIPLSHFELDHPRPPEGWANFLGRRAIAFVPDDLGRDCVRRQDARRLLDERRADQLRAAKLRQLAEAEAVEADQRRRALIWKGVSATALPEGVTASAAMLQAAKDESPRRRSMLEEAFAGQGLTFHSYQTAPEDES